MKEKEAKAVSNAPRGNYVLIPSASWDDSAVRLNYVLLKKRNHVIIGDKNKTYGQTEFNFVRALLCAAIAYVKFYIINHSKLERIYS